jgi:hypothetical protein
MPKAEAFIRTSQIVMILAFSNFAIRFVNRFDFLASVKQFVGEVE